jgi:hypothetical protein
MWTEMDDRALWPIVYIFFEFITRWLHVSESKFKILVPTRQKPTE